MTNLRKAGLTALRIAAAVAALALIGLVLAFANAVAGNPISKAIARNRAEVYLKEVYPESTIDAVSYNLIDESYGVKYTIDGEQRTINCKGKRITDYNAAAYYKEKFERDFQEVKEEIETDVLSLHASAEMDIIADGAYSTDFDKLTLGIRLLLTIENTDADISKRDSGQMAAKVTRQVLDVLESMYHIDGIDVVYLDAFGRYDIWLQSGTFSLEQLQQNTKRAEPAGEYEESFVSGLTKTTS